MKKPFHFLILFALFFVSCGRVEDTGDLALLVGTGGILPIKKTTLCNLGILTCPIEDIVNAEANETTISDVNNTNLPPRLEFYVSSVDMTVGDERNLLLRIVDPDDDNLTDVYYFVEDPTLAVLEILERPHALKITAKKEGNTNLKVLARDSYLNEGSTVSIPLSILEVNPTAPVVKLTTNLVELDVSTSTNIKYVYAGLRPGYDVTSRINNGLVTVQVNKSTETITINAKKKGGTDQIALTFVDSKNTPVTENIAVLVTGEEPPVIVPKPPVGGGDGGDGGDDPTPTGPTETEWFVFNDTGACLNAFPWKSLTHHYSNVKDRTVSSKNSISITSLTADAAVTLYYKEEADKVLETPYGYDITAPNNPSRAGQSLGLPVKGTTSDETRDKTRLFILQFPDAFLGAGTFYLDIKGDCYRGIFPNTGSPNDLQAAKYDVKMVVNEE